MNEVSPDPTTAAELVRQLVDEFNRHGGFTAREIQDPAGVAAEVRHVDSGDVAATVWPPRKVGREVKWGWLGGQPGVGFGHLPQNAAVDQVVSAVSAHVLGVEGARSDVARVIEEQPVQETQRDRWNYDVGYEDGYQAAAVAPDVAMNADQTAEMERLADLGIAALRRLPAEQRREALRQLMDELDGYVDDAKRAGWLDTGSGPGYALPDGEDRS